MNITIYKSNAQGAYTIFQKPQTIQETMETLLKEQTSNYKVIYYANVSGNRLYPDGSGQTFEYFEHIKTTTLKQLLERAETTCVKGAKTILRLEGVIKEREGK